jgi:hypothetical protein
MISIKMTILIFTKVLVNNPIHQWIGFISVSKVKLYLKHFYMSPIEHQSIFTTIITHVKTKLDSMSEEF